MRRKYSSYSALICYSCMRRDSMRQWISRPNEPSLDGSGKSAVTVQCNPLRYGDY